MMLAACRMAGHEADAWVGHLQQLQLEPIEPVQFAKVAHIFSQLPQDQQKVFIEVGVSLSWGAPCPDWAGFVSTNVGRDS